LIRELLGLQLVEIGTAFGGRDHSTVIHSLEKVLELNQQPDFKRRIDTLRENLRQLPR
jgi:chromosomal replication initiator protein